MSKVTTKLQVTLPKALATAHGIRPGDDIEWVSAGDVIRVIPPRTARKSVSVAERLRRFDEATARQRLRQRRLKKKPAAERGWTREELYERGRAR